MKIEKLNENKIMNVKENDGKFSESRVYSRQELIGIIGEKRKIIESKATATIELKEKIEIENKLLEESREL
jgi:hypothetical protein